VFSRQRYRDILIESFKFSQENKGLKVYAFVIMSNHVHCILSADGDNLSDIIGAFKSFTAKKIINSIVNEPGESRKEWMIGQMKYVAKARKAGSEHQFWAEGNHPVPLYNNEFFIQKLNYIHQNPVRAGIVKLPEHYVYSSASVYCGESCLLDICLFG
jgi:REP element-mobilizing transposase RayT